MTTAQSCYRALRIHTAASALLAALLLAPSAYAAPHDHGAHATQTAQAGRAESNPSNNSNTSNPDQPMLADGQVKKIDKTSGKVTLSHGPIKNLSMPAMTMVFRVKEAAWLDTLAAGDKIRFQAETIDGALTIVRFETAK